MPHACSRIARVVMLAAVMSVTAVRAANAEWFVAPFLGVKFGGSTTFPDPDAGASNTKLVYGATAGVLSDGIFGIEADFGYAPRFFEQSGSGLIARSQVLTLMGNVIVAVPRSMVGLSLRPFVSGGAGWMRVGIDDVIGAFTSDHNLAAINVGGGAVGALTYRTSLRFELRYFKSLSSEDPENAFGRQLSFWRSGVGVSLRY